MKLTQTQLARLMGFSYQQIQKYETGASETTVGKLLQFAQVLNVPPAFFYEGAAWDSRIGLAFAEEAPSRCRTHPLQILLIETNPADVVAFRQAIETSEEQVDLYVIYEAEKVADYLQHYASKYGRRLPELIVLDALTAKSTQPPLLRLLKTHATSAELPVLMLTHGMRKKELQEAYRAGASGFIQKHVEKEQFEEAIRTTIRYWAQVVTLPNM